MWCGSLAVMKLSMMCAGVCGLLFVGSTSIVLAEKDGVGDGVPDGVVEQLSSEKFEVRVGAYAELKKWSKKNPKSSPAQLHKIWVSSDDPEVKTRCYTLMKEMVIQRKFGKGKGFVGIMMDPMVIGGGQPQGKAKVGIRIVQVLPNTPANKAGLQPGDFIVGIDELDFNKLPVEKKQIDVRTTFQEYVKSKQPDDVITLHLLRAGKAMDQDVTLMKRPASADRGFFNRGENLERAESEAYFEKWLKQAEAK